MGLRAKRPGANQQTAGATVNETEVQNTMPQAQEQTQEQTGVPATRQPAAPAQRQNNNNALADLNAGILDNIDDIGSGGSYVTMDGSNFLYKASNETATEIEAIITYGKRFYQWYDEENKQYHNSDTKLDDRYKLKFEIRWNEEMEEGEVQEMIMSLPTASAMRFIDYVRDLAKNKGYGVGQVVTKMTISRQKRQGSNDRYSRTEFEFAGLAE